MNKLLVLITCFAMSHTAFAEKLKTQFYGYVEGYVEQVEPSPTWTGGTASSQGKVEEGDNPHEFDTPHVNLMMKSTKGSKYASFINLDASGDSVGTRNAWVELKGKAVKFRMGKLYRPFGLYNERLDAVPTYIGIESPELFDKDHLLLTRTTNLMIHGEKDLNGDTFRWAFTTGNDERSAGEVPVGADFRYTKITEAGNEFLIGLSYYYSGNKAKYDSDVKGGVAAWMAEDEYTVAGIYTEYTTDQHKVQFAYYQASHDGVRDLTVVNGWDPSTLNDGQREQICDDSNWGSCTEEEAKYDITTWYIRYGYTFESSFGELTPYIQWDYYKNPEMIANKDLGGDNEAGLSDDGSFVKQTLGIVIRPDRQLAIKVDASNHQQEMDGKDENYAEIRSSFSYIWSM